MLRKKKYITDDLDDQTPSKINQVNRLDVWLLGFVIASGGKYHDWIEGLANGTEWFLIGTLIIALAYTCLCFSISEIASGLPFSGGAYGFSRCTLGFFVGFLVGCFETIEYLLYSASLISFLSSVLCHVSPTLYKLYPLVNFVLYVPLVLIQIRGGKVFWSISFILALTSILTLLVYVFGPLDYLDYAKHAPSMKDSARSEMSFLRSLPYASCFFIGVESMNLAANKIVDPHINLPRMQMTCMFVVLLKAFVLFIIAISLPGGMENLTQHLSRYTTVFKLVFKTSEEIATLATIPITYASANGFMWSYSHLICAMSKSKLFPSSLSTPSKYGTPYKGILVGASISYVLSLGVDSCQVVNDIVYFVCMMSACLTYIAYCCAFFKMRTTFKSIPRSFHSPFGCAGAIFSISIWVLNFIVLGIMEHWILAPLFGSLTVFLSFLYYKFIKKQQIFSEEENEILLRVHIVNFNSKKDKNSKSNHTNKNSGGAKIIPINGPSSSIGASRHSHSSVPRYTELEKPITI